MGANVWKEFPLIFSFKRNRFSRGLNKTGLELHWEGLDEYSESSLNVSKSTDITC